MGDVDSRMYWLLMMESAVPAVTEFCDGAMASADKVTSFLPVMTISWAPGSSGWRNPLPWRLI